MAGSIHFGAVAWDFYKNVRLPLTNIYRRGHLDHLEDIYNTNEMDENLVTSMQAVGLAGFSHVLHAPELLKNARLQYAKALQLTNTALRSPTQARKDSTLLSVMILSIFEAVTGCTQRSIKAWADHINGAAALVKLRGLEQLRTSGGRRMFIQVTTSLLINCIQRCVPVPTHIMELRAEASKYSTVVESAWFVQDAMVAYANFRASVRNGTLADPRVILRQALELEAFWLSIFADIPPGWKYETVYTDDDPDIVFNGRYHVYYDFWIAQLWNAMRTVRILINEKIQNTLLDGFSSKPPLFVGPEYVIQLQLSTDLLYQLQTDIFASVPQHIGYVSKRRSSSPSASTSTMSASSNQSDTKSRCSDFRDFPFDEKPNKVPSVRSSGGYFLLWPLFVAGSMDITTDSMRLWVVQNLRSVGHSMGIQQALVLAEVLQMKEEIKVWHEKQETTVGATPS